MIHASMIHASLFSGIGGFDLAAQWIGWSNAFHCEINPFCLRILKHHFPNSVTYENIKKTDFAEWCGKIDIVTAGFPCQPFSIAGCRKGANDDRYLWPEVLRAVSQIRPRWFIGENVAGIISMVQPGQEVRVENKTSLFGQEDEETIQEQQYVVETICSDLEQIGYSVQPFLIPACAVGAPHRRDRVWFVAYSDSCRCDNRRESVGKFPDSPDTERNITQSACQGKQFRAQTVDTRTFAPDSARQRLETTRSGFPATGVARTIQNILTDPRSQRFQKLYLMSLADREEHPGRGNFTQFLNRWKKFPAQPPLCRGDDGFSLRLDAIAISKWRNETIKAYGNAIVPQVAYKIFHAIEITEKELTE